MLLLEEDGRECLKFKLDQNLNNFSCGPREKKNPIIQCTSAVPRVHRSVRVEEKLFEKRMDLRVDLKKGLIADRSLAFACCFC